MSFIATALHLVHEIKAMHERYRNEREIGALPFDVQKDIGWPQANDGPQARTVH